MTNTHNQQPTSQSVLAEIRARGLHMRPRWHFLLQTSLSVLAALCVFLAAIYLMSLVIFVIRESGLAFAPRFGYRGWTEFLRSFPWLLVIGSLVFLAVLEELLRRYSFVYKRPLLYSTGALVVILTLASVIADLDDIHPQIRNYSNAHGVPIYNTFAQPPFGRPSHFFHGQIISTASGTTTILKQGGAQVHIDIETQMPDNNSSTDTPVVIFGETVNGQFRAYGVSREPAPAQ